MQCALAISVGDYEQFFGAYGLRFCLEAVSELLDDQRISVLVMDGFDAIPKRILDHFRPRKIDFIDVTGLTGEVLGQPGLERVKGQNTYLRTCFARHLVMERYFPGEAVLSFDADIVWRMNPFDLATLWTGGSFVFDGSPCITFAKDGEWFRCYREGLERWATDPSFGQSFEDRRLARNGINHDQDLLQYLAQNHLIEQDTDSIRAHPETAAMCMFANPLHLENGIPVKNRKRPKLTFTRDETGDRLGGRLVPFWHMQTSFAKYIAYYLISSEVLLGRHRIVSPIEQDESEQLSGDLLNFLYVFIRDGKISGDKFAFMQQMFQRSSLYKQFFKTSLPDRLFTKEVWWKPGIFA